MGILGKLFGLTPIGAGFNRGAAKVENSEWAKGINAKIAKSEAEEKARKAEAKAAKEAKK